ncbi:hypothetical protein CEXT_332671 [Caerostris extrusa]|uniref:Uncharacterized protein n=1 Tax=Caerostris extrusa TaxID=172846 RepID=A0AAV4X294_CAEEX|nr:hypothetical protein CEXT_332671 [Caerostris extrusa]
MDNLSDAPSTVEDLPKSSEVTSESPKIAKKQTELLRAPSEIKDKKNRSRKEHKSNFFLECLPQSNILSSSPKVKRGKNLLNLLSFIQISIKRRIVLFCLLVDDI